jgi:hypothetical protein
MLCSQKPTVGPCSEPFEASLHFELLSPRSIFVKYSHSDLGHQTVSSAVFFFLTKILLTMTAFSYSGPCEPEISLRKFFSPVSVLNVSLLHRYFLVLLIILGEQYNL